MQSAISSIFGIGSKIETEAQTAASSVKLKSMARRAKGTLHLLTFLASADAVFLCAFYALIVRIFAPLVLSGDPSFLDEWPLVLLPVFGRFLTRTALAACLAKFSYEIENVTREELLLRMLAAGPLAGSLKSSLSTQLSDAFDEIMPYFTGFVSALRHAMTVPVVLLVAIAIVSPGSALILFCMAPLIPLFMVLIGKGAERLNRRQWAQITRMAVRFYESCNKLLLIRLFGLEQREIYNIGMMTRRWRVESMQVLRIAFLSALVLEFFSTCGIALCAMTLGFVLYQGGFDYGKALFVLLCAPEFFLPLRQLGLNYHTRMRALGAVSSLAELLKEKPLFPLPPELAQRDESKRLLAEYAAESGKNNETAENSADSDEEKKAGSLDFYSGQECSCSTENDESWLNAPYTIELQHITAVYPDGRAGLKNFSCVIHPLKFTVLTGASGSGKTTLLHTLAGFTKITEGCIKVNGHICSYADLMKLMSKCTYIPQLPHLFAGTLRDNLSLGCKGASDEELTAALKIVGAEDIITRFPEGLDHLTGDGNRGISGGEVRLIALARAFVRNSELILLDEPTASLDRESEDAFLNALSSLRKGKTVITVAHRRELIDFADEILPVKGVSTER